MQIINSSEDDHSIGDPLQIPFTEEQTDKIDNGKTNQFTHFKEISTRKRKADMPDKDIPTTENCKRFEKDEYTLFGELVAIKLRQLTTEHAKIVVQHIINTTLFDGQMGKYNSPSVFQNGSGSRQSHNYYHPEEMVKMDSSMQSSSLEPYAYISQNQTVTPSEAIPSPSPGSYGSGSQPPTPTPTKTEVQFPEPFDME